MNIFFFFSSIEDSQAQVQPFTTPPLAMQQYRPHEGSDGISEHQSFSQNPTTTSPTSSSGIMPQSKGAPLIIPSRSRRDSLHSRPLTESPEPPGYNE